MGMRMGLTSTLSLYLNRVLDLSHSTWRPMRLLDVCCDLVLNYLFIISVLEIRPWRRGLAVMGTSSPCSDLFSTASLLPHTIQGLLVFSLKVCGYECIKVDSFIVIDYFLDLIDLVNVDSRPLYHLPVISLSFLFSCRREVVGRL